MKPVIPFATIERRGQTSLVFSVALPNRAPVYMSAVPASYGFDDYRIVIVGNSPTDTVIDGEHFVSQMSMT